MRQLIIGCVLLLSGLLITGCATTKQLQEKSAEASRYQKEAAQLLQRVAEQNDQIAALVSERDSLRTLSSQRELEIERLQAEIQSLSEQNQSLTAAMDVSTAEKDRMISELSSQKGNLESRLAQSAYDLGLLEKQYAEIEGEMGAIRLAQRQEIESMKSTYDRLLITLQQEIEKGEITITQLQNHVSVQVVDQVLFLSGETVIRKRGQEVLARIGGQLKDLAGYMIVIEGHTDNVPIGEKLQERFPTNWELATTRATTVTRTLIEQYGVDPRNISAAGYSEYSPVATNTTKEGRAQNRRIEIILIPVQE
ncbi:OmpA family protein [Candidatus Neomarinimicrobiota bacterium]